MIIYLYGQDSYRRKNKVDELIRAYQEKHSNLDTFVCDFKEDDDWQKAKDFLNQPSMFVEAKLAVLYEVVAIEEKEWAKTLESYKDKEKTFVIVSDSKGPNKLFSFLLKPPVKSQEFSELEGPAFFEFLRKEAASRRLNFSREAWQFFCSYIISQNEKSWLGVNELEKISLAGFKSPISLKDLERVINFERRTMLFRAAAEILSGGPRYNLPILERLFLQKEAPAHIFNTLAFQARGKTLIKLADYDISVKSGGLDYEEALTDFTLRS